MKHFQIKAPIIKTSEQLNNVIFETSETFIRNNVVYLYPMCKYDNKYCNLLLETDWVICDNVLSIGKNIYMNVTMDTSTDFINMCDIIRQKLNVEIPNMSNKIPKYGGYYYENTENYISKIIVKIMVNPENDILSPLLFNYIDDNNIMGIPNATINDINTNIKYNFTQVKLLLRLKNVWSNRQENTACSSFIVEQIIFKNISQNNNTQFNNFNIIINSNIFKHKLTQYLSVNEMYYLYLANVYDKKIKNKIWNVLCNNMIEKIETFLSKYIPNYKNFAILLEKYNGVISGSCIPFIINGDTNNIRDIDIYFKNIDDFTNFKQNCEPQYGSIFQIYKDIGDYDKIQHIVEIYKMEPLFGSVYIQFIILDNYNVSHYIYNYYDFDIVRNILYYKNSCPIIKIFNINDIIKKTSGIKSFGSISYDNVYRKNTIYDRINKYTNIKHINFDISRSINAIYEYCDVYYPRTFFTNICNNQIININDYCSIDHNYNLPVTLYKITCPENECIFKLFDLEHYHTKNNDGRLLHTNNDIMGIYKDNIHLIHINIKHIKIPISIDVTTHCNIKKIVNNKSYLNGKYIFHLK
jgi:hypothetical protein